MIRPATFVALMLACSSGAYLFVVKHRAEALDHQIGSVTSQIRLTERRIRVLQAEWASENDPSRLAQLSQQFLHLAPMAPDQLVTLNRLAELLPQPGAGLPHLPLPPPSPKAPSVQPELDQAGPAAPAANAPIASAAPVPAPAAAPVQLASALPLPKLAHPAPLHEIHKAAFAAKRPMPVSHPVSRPVRHIVMPAHAYARPYGRDAAARTSSQIMAVTAERAAIPAMPAFNAMPDRRETSGRVASGTAQSVFGAMGANLAPPKPVYRGSQ